MIKTNSNICNEDLRMRNRLIFSLVLVALMGCQNNAKQSNAVVAFEPTEMDALVYQSVESIQKSLRVLAETKNAETQKAMSYEQRQQARLTSSALPYGLDKKITMNWHGEADGALKMLANLTNYQFSSPLGVKPKNGVMINIAATNRTAYDILRDIGSQAGERATVRVIPNTKTRLYGIIELEYKR